MFIWILSLMMIASVAFAEVGRVVKLSEKSDAYLVRNKVKVELKSNTLIEAGDELNSGNGILNIQFYPETQVMLYKDSQLLLLEASLEVKKNQVKAFSVVKLLKGSLKVRTTVRRDQEVERRWETEGISAAIGAAEFELTLQETKNVDLDVSKGQAAVSSPFIQSFVPEMVKAQQGLTFNWQEKSLKTRAIRVKTEDTLFEKDRVITKNWNKVRKKLKK